MIKPAFKRYPALRERFNSVVLSFLKKSMEPTRKLVSDMVAFVASPCVCKCTTKVSKTAWKAEYHVDPLAHILDDQR